MADENLSLFINTLDGQSLLVAISPIVSVQTLKLAISELTAVPLHRQRLLYKSALLSNNRTLQDYPLQSGDTVHLVAKLEYSSDRLLQFAHILVRGNLRFYRRLRQIQLRPLSFAETLQVLTQHSLTIDRLLQCTGITWAVGQWVDVKDTVDQ